MEIGEKVLMTKNEFLIQAVLSFNTCNCYALEDRLMWAEKQYNLLARKGIKFDDEKNEYL